MPVVRLVAVGDIMFGDSPQVFGFGVASMIRSHGPQHPFRHVRQMLRDAEVVVGNLETVIATAPPESAFADRVYRGHPGSVDGLADAGFDVVSVCTNHMMQHGQSAFEECVGLLSAHGLEVVGAECPAHAVTNLSVLERNGLRLGFLGYNFRPIQYFTAPPAWRAPDAELIAADLARVRDSVDVLIVSLHWGDEFIEHPAPAQVALAHQLVDAGADVILGHHPHIVQGVERYRGAVIAYSLGNFIYDQWQERLRRSCMLRLTIRGARDIDCILEPLLINGIHQPIPYAESERAAVIAHLAELSRMVGAYGEVEYQDRLAHRYRRFRREVLTHYATRFWKFHPRDLAANIRGIIGRRV